MISPALGLEVVGVYVIAAADWRHDSTDVLAVLDYGVANREVAQCNLVADGNVLIAHGMNFTVILGYDTQNVVSRGEIFDHDHPDVVVVVVDE